MNNRLDPDALDTVILCGGLGTRLQNILKDKPKPMADFNDRPFLDLLIEYVGRFGFKRFILCSGHKGDPVKEYFKDKNNDKTFIISQETSPLGTAGAIKLAGPLIKSNIFLAMNGDSFCDIDLTAFIDFHYSKCALASVALVPIEDTRDYGRVVLGNDDEIIRFDEKSDTPASGWINARIRGKIPLPRVAASTWEGLPGPTVFAARCRSHNYRSHNYRSHNNYRSHSLTL